MGMQGPLTAQALGRSPYDDDFEFGDDAQSDGPAPQQEYDHRGRPINPDTKRLNRDIIRAHNEVMLVIGVAEPDNPNGGPEAELERQHKTYEEGIGLRLASIGRRCIDAVGLFGIDGLRQRILVYNRFADIPFYTLYQQARRDFSITRDVFPGAPAALVANYGERYFSKLWPFQRHRYLPRQCVHEVWSYVRVHLELYVTYQNLGLIPSSQWLPRPSYFVPFMQDSPIQAPPPPNDLSLGSLLQWFGGLVISAAPFLVWVTTQKVMHDVRPQIWGALFGWIPSTVRYGKKVVLPPPPPPPVARQPLPEEGGSSEAVPSRARDQTDDVSPLRNIDDHTGPVEAVRRPSVFSSRGDEYATDDEDNEGLSRTLISFDVEASESTDAPPGLWSAELRPSMGNEQRQVTSQHPVYLDTILTQLPPLIATHIFTDALTSLFYAPYEAAALRLLARSFRLQRGLPCSDILGVNLLSGLSWTFAANFLGGEFLYLLFTSEVWAILTMTAQYFHLTEAQWKELHGRDDL